MRPKAYSYVRMSTETQAKGDSTRRQLSLSREYAERHGLDLVDSPITDHMSGYTGANIETGSFGRFLEAVRNSEIPKGSYLLVESLDRLSRKEPLSALEPFKQLISSGIILVTLKPEMVFKHPVPVDQLLFTVVDMSRAHNESVLKSSRLSKAWEAKRSRANDIKLTARAPAWLKLSEDRKTFHVIEERADVVRRIFHEAASGIGAYTIVRRLNEEGVPTFRSRERWQTSTVNKYIGSVAAIGHFQPGRKIEGQWKPEGDLLKDYFPPIVEEKLFYAAQTSRLGRKTRPTEGIKGSGGRKGKRHSNLFTKIARCGYCRGSMIYQNKGTPPKGYAYLVCSSATQGGGCKYGERWRYDHFETSFLAFVEQLNLESIVSNEQQTSRRAELAKELDSLEGAEKLAEQQRDRSYELTLRADFNADFLLGKLREHEQRLEETRQRKIEVKRQIAEIDVGSREYYDDADHIKDLIHQVRAQDDKDVYTIRALIAMRLHAIVSYLEITASDMQFEVQFKDGTVLIVFVNEDDPLKFNQIVKGDDNALVSIDPSGREDAFSEDYFREPLEE